MENTLRKYHQKISQDPTLNTIHWTIHWPNAIWFKKIRKTCFCSRSMNDVTRSEAAQWSSKNNGNLKKKNSSCREGYQYSSQVISKDITRRKDIRQLWKLSIEITTFLSTQIFSFSCCINEKWIDLYDICLINRSTRIKYSECVNNYHSLLKASTIREWMIHKRHIHIAAAHYLDYIRKSRYLSLK